MGGAVICTAFFVVGACTIYRRDLKVGFRSIGAREQAAWIVAEHSVALLFRYAAITQHSGEHGGHIAERFVAGQELRGAHTDPGRHGERQTGGGHRADAIL